MPSVMMSLTKSSIMLVLTLVPVAEVDGQSTGTCTDPPCAVDFDGRVGDTIIDHSTYNTGTDLYGPFEAEFPTSDSDLARLCATSDVSNSDIIAALSQGVDMYTNEQMIAAQCGSGTDLPRLVDGEYFGILDQCGALNGNFHENMECLYSNAATGHSPALADVLSQNSDGSTQKLYGKWENYNPDSSTYILPAVDACNGHFGVTPESNGAAVYHYHSTDLPPFTVGCFGPAKSADNQEILVSPTTCRGLYTGDKGCGGGDTVRITTPSGSRNYDPWCPCWSGLSNVEGGEAPSPPPSEPISPTDITHTLTFNAGWTWVSSPLMDTSADSSAGALGRLLDDLDGLAASSDDLIKDQSYFTNFIPGFGWFGQLDSLSSTNMYKVRLASSGDFSLTGTPPDINGRDYVMNAGWTWLGWPVMTPGLIQETFQPALVDPSLLNSQDDRIKDQYQFTSYIPGYGWFGDLQQFQPGSGYQVKLVEANILRNFGIVGVERRQRKLESVPAPPRVVGSGEWQVAPASFENSMCLVVAVVIDGAVAEDGDLAAFVNGELRGIARPSSHKAPVGSYKGFKTYNLMAYGQADSEGATVAFQYRHADGRLTSLTQTKSFQKDGFIGSVIEPFVVDATTAAKKPIATTNPTNTQATNLVREYKPEILSVEPTSSPTLDGGSSPSVGPATTTGVPFLFLAAIAASALALVLLTFTLCVRRVRAAKAEAELEPTTPGKLPA